MGDFRASIKIDMNLLGQDYKFDAAWINYTDNGSGVDPRVEEFFRDAWEDAQSRYDVLVDESQAQEREAEERKAYERLKEKFG